MPLTLLLGGARSGKSALAVRLARGWGLPVTFIATARPSDAGMEERIARHRAERPPAWECVEEALDLAGALRRGAGRGVVVDCLTVWVANLLEGASEAEVLEAGERAAVLAAQREAPTIAVGNEVGLGVHPATESGRRYRDVLGRVNAAWAEAADQALLVVAGRVLDLRPAPLPGGEDA